MIQIMIHTLVPKLTWTMEEVWAALTRLAHAFSWKWRMTWQLFLIARRYHTIF